MTIKKNIVLLFCILLLPGCKNGTIPENEKHRVPELHTPLIIDINRDFSKEQEIWLSEIANDIEYVKLEKTPESVVGGGIPSWYITKEYVFVYSRSQLLQFYRNGKFIKQIGRNGRGPGEFQSLRGMTLDESNSILYLIANFKNKVLKYNVNTGEFLGDIPISDNLGSSMLKNPFQIIGNDIFVALSHPMTQFTSDYVLFEIFDGKGNVLISKKSSRFSIQEDEKKIRRIPNAFTGIWSFGGQFRLYEDLNDTIYNINDNQLEPVFILNLGKYKGPFDEMTTIRVYDIKKYIRLYNFWETSSYLFFSFFHDGKTSNYGQFDKINKEFHQLFSKEGNSNIIYNDIDGGLSFWPQYSVDKIDNEWINCFDAIEFKQKLSEDWFQTSETKYPEKKEQLKRFMDELTINDNPVLMIVKLK